jgi:hypothetical protein
MVTGAALTAAGLTCYPLLNDQYPRAAALAGAVTLPLTLLGLASYVRLRRGEGRSCRPGELAVVAVASAGAGLFFCAGAVLVLNGALDPGPTRQHTAPILEVWPRPPDEDYRARLVVVSWRPGRDTEVIFSDRLAPEPLIEACRPGQVLSITTSPGLLGLERLVAVDLARGSQAGPSAGGSRSPGSAGAHSP